MSGTPRDQSAWVLEEFPDRPNAVRWTYQITDKDYKEPCVRRSNAGQTGTRKNNRAKAFAKQGFSRLIST